MSNKIAPWNILQFLFISVFTCFSSFLWLPEGGMFLAAVYVVLVLVIVPVLFLQLKLGGYLQKGIVGIFSMFFPIWKGVGIVALIDLLIRITNIAPIVAQFGTYGFIAITKHPYVWGSCTNTWNTDFCDSKQTPVSVGQLIRQPAEKEFYLNEFLQLSSGIEDIGGFPQWSFTEIARNAEVSLMPVALAVVWVLVFLFVGFGGRVCGWIMFLLGPGAVACLLAVLGYGYAHLDSKGAWKYIKTAYTFHDDHLFLVKWLKGFRLVINALPVWTAIAATMGTMAGRGRTTRNTTWLVLTLVYGLFCQLPPLAMAPYLGGAFFNESRIFERGPDLLLWKMPRAFTILAVPPEYVLLFYLSAFLFGLMFLCIGCLTIVHNIMDALADWVDKKGCSKVAVHLLMTLIVMIIAKSMGILQTTKAGIYYFALIDLSIGRLQFILVILMALGLLVVYVKQNFALAERIIVGLWFGIAAIACAGIECYMFMRTYENPIRYNDYVHPYVCNIISWVIAAFPFVGIIIGAIHAIIVSMSDRTKKCKHLWCGITERVREHDGDDFQPPPPEPSAPPYAYTYMEHSYPLDDMNYKLDYEEMEPLASSNSMRI